MGALEYLMRRSIALSVILSLALAAEANDTGEISLRSRALAAATTAFSATTMPSPSFAAPVSGAPRHGESVISGRDPLPQLMLLDEQEAQGVKSACETTSKDFCYDLAQRRVVYRGAREYMPTLGGLSPEGISLRHNRIVLSYSFK
jgi:hypothetical protein